MCGATGKLVVARAALHFWEEPPISGEAGSGAVFFSNCPLHCVYCQNAVIADGTYGLEITVDRLAEIFRELEAQGALNINCVTPTHYALQIRDAVKAARAHGLAIPIVWNTSGYERVEAIEALADTVDIYLTDFKYAAPGLAAAYSHARDYTAVALAAIDKMVETVGRPRDVHGNYYGEGADTASPDAQGSTDPWPPMARGVIIRHLLLPGALEESKRALDIIHARWGNDVLVSIMNQYTPILASAAAEGKPYAVRALAKYPQLGGTVPASEYEELLDYADALGMQDYFWQEGPAAKESFVPAWDATGVLPADA